jgi:hypothetical protein
MEISPIMGYVDDWKVVKTYKNVGNYSITREDIDIVMEPKIQAIRNRLPQ